MGDGFIISVLLKSRLFSSVLGVELDTKLMMYIGIQDLAGTETFTLMFFPDPFAKTLQFCMSKASQPFGFTP